MGNPAIVYPISLQRMVCTSCGAEANASCNCGQPYVPKAIHAREAVKANPEKSDRAIAADISVAKNTVRAARQELVSADQLKDGPRTGLDGKTRKMPGKPKVEPEDDEPAGFTALDYNGLMKEYRKLDRRYQKLEGERTLPKGDDEEHITVNDYIELHARARKLEDQRSTLMAALNEKEAQQSRNWPADMTPKQIRHRDKCLTAIAAWQRDLEQLYGEVTGCPSWRVEITTKDGRRLGTGARFGTRGEAEFYNTNLTTHRAK
jgi:hypothetical protein